MSLAPRRHRLLASLLVAVVALSSSGFVLLTGAETDRYLAISRSLELFGRIYRAVSSDYVDVVDPAAFVRAGIDGMLATLDPYTVYLDGEEASDLELITTGKYAGIGVTLALRDGQLVVIAPTEGYAAERAGIRPGDRLLRIDSTDVSHLTPTDVRLLVRGAPGTSVGVTVNRAGVAEPLEFSLTREEIQVRNVTWSGRVAPGVGYIGLDRFSRRAGEEVRQAITALQSPTDEPLTGVILDLRGNPGGLLDAAIDVTEAFVPTGSLIVSTRARGDAVGRKVTSDVAPVLDPSVPLIVLIDGGSASASEIVAGALQDLDRAVLVGERSFGKGLVQTVVPLGGRSSLKITTARYYTPSGRSIQAIDYSAPRPDHRTPVVVADSLRHPYQTRSGRLVYDRGGIAPDTTVVPPTADPLLVELRRQQMIFRFADRYAAAHPTLPDNFQIDSALLRQFDAFLVESHFTYESASEVKLKELRALLGPKTAASPALAGLERDLSQQKALDPGKHQDEIRRQLLGEIAGRYGNERGRQAALVPGDPQVKAAVALLGQPQRRLHLLNQ